MGRVDGKVVVVTGAGSGQGLAESVALAREGATVIATGLGEEAPELPESVVYHRLDVSRPEDWSELGGWVGERHGRVHGLVNNAGIPLRERLLDVGIDDWERVLSVNLTGSLLGIQTVAPLMTAGGSIVNVSSVAALGGHFAAAYTTSKWAVRGLSRVASLELGPAGIRVNTLLPGYIETPMTASAPPAFLDANIAAAPLGRTGTVEDIAPLVVYLISDESAFVSGAEIVVDGGQTAHGGAKSISDALQADAG